LVLDYKSALAKYFPGEAWHKLDSDRVVLIQRRRALPQPGRGQDLAAATPHGTLMSVGLHHGDAKQVYVAARYGEVFGT
jgi:hypothetical protein